MTKNYPLLHFETFKEKNAKMLEYMRNSDTWIYEENIEDMRKEIEEFKLKERFVLFLKGNEIYDKYKKDLRKYKLKTLEAFYEENLIYDSIIFQTLDFSKMKKPTIKFWRNIHTK